MVGLGLPVLVVALCVAFGQAANEASQSLGLILAALQSLTWQLKICSKRNMTSNWLCTESMEALAT